MVSETKLDDSFPQGQFIINGFKSPFRLDRNKNCGGIMLYIREDIPANLKYRKKYQKILAFCTKHDLF